MSRLTIVTLPVYCLGCVFTRSTFEKLHNKVFKNQFWRWPSRSPPTVHNTKFSFLKYIYKWENISVIYIPKKTKTILLLHILPIELKKTFTYICVYLSSYIYIYIYASGHQFWNISVLLYANSITNVVSYNCCCWCMVCVEILQTQFNILWYNFFLWWSSLKQTNNYWKKILKNWDIIMMMIWSRDLQTIFTWERDNSLCIL